METSQWVAFCCVLLISYSVLQLTPLTCEIVLLTHSWLCTPLILSCLALSSDCTHLWNCLVCPCPLLLICISAQIYRMSQSSRSRFRNTWSLLSVQAPFLQPWEWPHQDALPRAGKCGLTSSFSTLCILVIVFLTLGQLPSSIRRKFGVHSKLELPRVFWCRSFWLFICFLFVPPSLLPSLPLHPCPVCVKC